MVYGECRVLDGELWIVNRRPSCVYVCVSVAPLHRSHQVRSEGLAS